MRKGAIILLIVAGLFGTAQAQKGEKSIAAGLFAAFPQGQYGWSDTYWKTSAGLEAIGQYNFSNKSAVLLQLQLTRFTGILYEYTTPRTYRPFAFNSLSLKGGYRYQFTPSGFYANVLAGIEGGKTGSYRYNETFFPVALGAGKRFSIKDFYFIDAGIERVSGYLYRWNIKAVFSLLRRPKEE